MGQDQRESLLLLRQLQLYITAVNNGHDIPFLLEHPSHPADTSDEPTAQLRSSIWATDTIQHVQQHIGLTITSFSQCHLGMETIKETTLATRHLNKLRQFNGRHCDHRHEYKKKEDTHDLARWPWGLNILIAESLADRLPQLQHLNNGTSTDRHRDTIRHTNVPSRDIQVTIGHKQRPLRDGGGKPSHGR